MATTAFKEALDWQDKLRIVSALNLQIKSFERNVRFAPSENLRKVYQQELDTIKALQARLSTDEMKG